MSAYSFYDQVMEIADRVSLDDARRVEGLDNEVALLRFVVRQLIQEDLHDPKVLQSGLRLLIQAVLAQHRLSGAQAEGLGNAVAALVEQVAGFTVPLDTTGDAA